MKNSKLVKFADSELIGYQLKFGGIDSACFRAAQHMYMRLLVKDMDQLNGWESQINNADHLIQANPEGDDDV